MKDLLLALQATVIIYKDCAAHASKAFLRNWLLVPLSLALAGICLLLAGLLAPLGMTGGIILGIAFIAALSLYYSWIAMAVGNEKPAWRSLLDFDWALFFSLIGVAFILSIVDLIVKAAQAPGAIIICVNFAIFVLLNAIPEIIYRHRYDSVPAIVTAFRFNKENWIEWYVPLLVLLIPGLLTDWRTALIYTAGTDVLLPILLLIKTIPLALPEDLLPPILAQFLALALGTWFMLFRGYLFGDLELGTRRRRIYQMRQR